MFSSDDTTPRSLASKSSAHALAKNPSYIYNDVQKENKLTLAEHMRPLAMVGERIRNDQINFQFPSPNLICKIGDFSNIKMTGLKLRFDNSIRGIQAQLSNKMVSPIFE